MYTQLIDSPVIRHPYTCISDLKKKTKTKLQHTSELDSADMPTKSMTNELCVCTSFKLVVMHVHG